MSEIKKINAFLTGSRVYGMPRGDSDLDLVILCSPGDGEQLWHEADGGGTSGQASTVFGKLNVIALCNPAEFEAWRAGTEECKTRSPVDRETAVAIISGHLAKAKAAENDLSTV